MSAARRHDENLRQGFGFATKNDLNLARRGTVELDPKDTGGWNGWVRYKRDDKKSAWISQTELGSALQMLEDDQATYLTGPPSINAIYNMIGRAMAAKEPDQMLLAAMTEVGAQEPEMGFFSKPEAKPEAKDDGAVAPEANKSKRAKTTDDPNDPKDRYYMAPALIWWFTENLPNRFRGCRTWKELCEAASDQSMVQCLAEGCSRAWQIGEDRELSMCLMSMWSHMDARAAQEEDWDVKWHANKNMMRQLLACYKRDQLADLERKQAQGGGAGGSSSSGGPGSSSSSTNAMLQWHVNNNVRGSWASQVGWAGTSVGRF